MSKTLNQRITRGVQARTGYPYMKCLRLVLKARDDGTIVFEGYAREQVLVYVYAVLADHASALHDQCAASGGVLAQEE